MYLEHINLSQLFNSDKDNISSGKCCSHIEYKEFSICEGSTCPILPNQSEVASNICIEVLDIKNSWRLCSDDKNFVKSFYQELKLKILIKKLGKKPSPEIIKKFLLDSSKEEGVKDWHWDNQKSWKGKCKDKSLLQSPIDITIINNNEKNSISNKAEQFGIEYQFNEAHTVVKKYFNEVNVHFIESAGVLKLANLVYQPQYLSFKFPAEHTLNSKRYPGEIQIFFNEMNPNVKTWVTNGLIISLPLSPGSNFPNLDFLEKLNIDFWNYSLKKQETYRPKTLENKKLKFSLQDLMKNILSKNPKMYSYVGGLTVPPCTQNIIHIVLDKPLELANCQFKVLRENSLLTYRPKEIHARLLQKLNNRKIIEVSRVKLNSVIKEIIPKIANQYKEYNEIVKKPELKIKTPIPSKRAKELNKELSKLKQKTLEALKVSGPEAKKIRKEALNILKGVNSADNNCENILK